MLGVNGALASLADTDFLRATRARIAADRERIVRACASLGLEVANPQGNFVFFRPGLPLREFREALLARRIEVARPFEPLLEWCRVSVGTTAETDLFLVALREVIRG
jgi:histidinol-phosphate aminotransferase